MIMNNKSVYRNLIYWGIDFMQTDVWSRINQSNHMNAFGDSIENVALGTENFAHNPQNKGSIADGDLKDAQLIVSSIIAFTQITGSRKIDLLHDIERAIRLLRFTFLEDENLQITLDQDRIDAILVEFLNFIGIKMWVDYAIYTRDLDIVDPEHLKIKS